MNKLYILLSTLFCLLLCVLIVFSFRKVTPTVTMSSGIYVAPLVDEKSQTQYTTLDISYPKDASDKYPELYSFIEKNKEDFLSQYGSLTSDDATHMDVSTENPYTFLITTTVATSTKTVSYIVEMYTFTGGAHGITTVGTFTYDASGKYLTLGDLFVSPYLGTVSRLARSYFYQNVDTNYDIKNENGESAIDVGTEALFDNFSAWYLTDSQIVFMFQQYAIGPGVLGIEQFPLDKVTVANILSPTFK